MRRGGNAGKPSLHNGLGGAWPIGAGPVMCCLGRGADQDAERDHKREQQTRNPTSRPHQCAGRPAHPAGVGPSASRRRAAHRDDRRRLRDRRPPWRRARRGRADRRAALPLRHATRPDHLGCRPSGLPPQNPDGPARSHPHAADGRGAFRLHQALRERVRPVRRRAFLNLDLGRGRDGRRPRPLARQQQRHRGDRRWRDVGRHGLRGDEQCRVAEIAAHRHPQ